MSKKLSEMTLEELWQLFPIFLREHQACWEEWYAEEEKRLKGVLPGYVKLYHIGSTAIKDIWAKPIIDILMEIPKDCDMGNIRDLVISAGYICMSETVGRISLNRGYTEEGFAQRVFHVHIRYTGDSDEILFRDYLNSHPQDAREYERLKLDLWKKYEHNRDAYTEGKTAFVKKILEKAR